MDQQTLPKPAFTPPPGYLMNARGHLIPEEQVRESDQLIDVLVREITEEGEALQAQMRRFKRETTQKIDDAIDIIAEKYDVKLGKGKGNVRLASFDGTQIVQISITDRLTFGVELKAAEALVKQCIKRWSEGANRNIAALVSDAFKADGQGKINKNALFGLLRLEIKDDPEWDRGMQALRDAIKTEGTASYLRLYRKANTEAPQQQISLDIAKL